MSKGSVRDTVISYLKTLPDDVTLEDIMYHLYVKEKILNGLKDVADAKVISNEKAKEIIEGWQK
jgi:hypothetical protein